MKHGKTLEQIERDERDVEDMRKDDASIVVEVRRAKKGREVRGLGAYDQDNRSWGIS